MKQRTILFLSLTMMIGLMSSCVSKKKLTSLQERYDMSQQSLAESDAQLAEYIKKNEKCQNDLASLKSASKASEQVKEEQIKGLKDQVEDLKDQRKQQAQVVEGLTVLSASANDNIKQTLTQLESKDKYLRMLQAARSKTDSINLALAVNLKGALSQGLNDQGIEIKVDKTVVFINLSDKMLYKSGSAKLSAQANDVLNKIATILKSRPGFDVMVEGYTDNKSIKNNCIEDNWDLSVKRATAVVRKLEKDFGINPSRLIAAGRGETNAVADNSTESGRAANRRTRIVILPQLNEFYDLLNPEKAAATIK